MRLLVPLGKHNLPHIALLVKMQEQPPSTSNPKAILQKLDEKPLYDEESLQFFQWMVEYYMASAGDMAYVALPGRVGGIKDWKATWAEKVETVLTPKKLFYALRIKENFSLRQTAKELGIAPKKLFSVLRRWYRQGALRLEAVVRQAARGAPSFVEVAPSYLEKSAFEAAYHTLPAPQQALFLSLLQRTLKKEPVAYAHILRQAGKHLHQLLRKGLVQRIPVRTYYEQLYARPLQPYELTPAQQEALQLLRTCLQEFPPRPVLLYGVTASGKTFLYMELIREQLQRGKQVLYLLPEIALTKQTLDRLRATFGEAMELYHSGLSEAERWRIWHAVRSDLVDVVVGTRSALFLPFHRLGLIIVDEEHDPSYGQETRAPFYQARDAAVYYAHLRQIPIVLGSATPSLESYANALRGKYHWVTLTTKALPTQPVQLHIVDMRAELREKLSTGIFSSVLVELLQQTLSQGQQAILFRNRRGYAPMLLCPVCGHRWECPSCAVTLTYHKREHGLYCHYCGHKEIVPLRCPICGNHNLTFSGIGTERVEEQLSQFFPGVRVLRLDRDMMQKVRHEAIIAAFERGEADVLVGTQLVTKGLDFERVSLVAVLYADSLLGRADFRAEERAYQMLVQFMGRSGRRGLQSHVVIQTFKPNLPLFQQLERLYPEYAEAALKQREKYRYPPFVRLLEVNLLHREAQQLEQQAAFCQKQLTAMHSEVLGPVYAEIPRIKGYYHMRFLLKLPLRYSLKTLRERLKTWQQSHYEKWGSRAARIFFRVDP